MGSIYGDVAYSKDELEQHGGAVVEIFTGTKTATGNTKTAPVEVMHFKEGTFFIDCTAKAGTTPTLNVTVLTYDKSGDDWHVIATFTELTDVGKEMKAVAANMGDKIAIVYTLGGTTPSFTFTVSAVLKVK